MNWKKFILLSCVVPCVFAVSTAPAQMRGHRASTARTYPYYGYYPYNYYGYNDSGYGYGNIVVEVQSRLARAGYYHGPIDGIMGPQTRRAIRAYERDHNQRAYGMTDQY